MERAQQALQDLIYLPSLKQGSPAPASALWRSPIDEGKESDRQAQCRPWDRVDLCSRLQSYKYGLSFLVDPNVYFWRKHQSQITVFLVQVYHMVL